RHAHRAALSTSDLDNQTVSALRPSAQYRSRIRARTICRGHLKITARERGARREEFLNLTSATSASSAVKLSQNRVAVISHSVQTGAQQSAETLREFQRLSRQGKRHCLVRG